MDSCRGDERLRHGRISERNRSYFITICTEAREIGLNAVALAPTLRAEIMAVERDGRCRIMGAVIMPNHVHLLVELSGTLPLSRIIARVKSKTRAALDRHHLRWQGNFYEHRLRGADSVNDVLRYLLLNPYRVGLVAAAETYSWFWLHPDEASWFRANLNEDRPYPEWLR